MEKTDASHATHFPPPDGPNPREDVNHWLQMSRQTRDPREALEYAQRAADVLPGDPRVRETLQECIFDLLRRDAFLAFVSEDDSHYLISLRNSRPIVVPKSRRTREKFPSSSMGAGERALRGIWLVALGLVPAGLGAMVLAPIVMWRSVRALDREETPNQERKLAWLALILAFGLCLLGSLFALMLVLHAT